MVLLLTTEECVSLSCSGHLLSGHGVILPLSLALGSWCLSLASVVIVCVSLLLLLLFVLSPVSVSPVFFSLALTNLLVRLLLALYAILGVVLRNLFSTGMSVSMVLQCLCTILNAFLAFGQNLVTNVGLPTFVVVVCVFFLVSVSSVSCFDLRALEALMLNLMFLRCLLISPPEYPLLIRFLLCCISIEEKLFGSEFVRRYLMASPTVMPLPVPLGW